MKSLSINPTVYSVLITVVSVVGVVYVIISGPVIKRIDLYLTGVHAIGYYSRQVLPPNGRYGSSIHEYSFQSTSGIKYFAESSSYFPQIEVIYNQDNPMENIANSEHDWFDYLFVPLGLFIFPVVILLMLTIKNLRKNSMKNLEIKVEVENFDDIKNRLAFSEHKDVLEQVDTYFLLGDMKIKIREEKISRELIIYFRQMKKGSRESRYYRLTLNLWSCFVVKSVLSSIFGVKVKVVKIRNVYLYKNTRIHTDTANGLGNFIELETVCRDPLCYKEYQDEHEEIKQKLSLNEYKTIAGSYSDLLWQKKLSHSF